MVSSGIISDIKVFDYNSDGNHDIVYRTALAGRPSHVVLIGNGDGTFEDPHELGKESDFFKVKEVGWVNEGQKHSQYRPYRSKKA